MTKKFTIPKSLAQAADMLYKVRAERLRIQHSTEDLQKQEAVLRDHIINNLPKSQAGGIAGKVCRVEIVTKRIPKVADMKKLVAYAKRKGNEDLLSVSMNAAAVKARWEAKKEVPGVETFNAVSLSIHKVKEN